MATPPINPTINTNRTTLFSSRYAKDAYAELERLESLYLATVRRKLGVDLYFSVSGEDKTTLYSIVVYYGGQTDEVTWLRENVKESAA